MLRVGRRVSVGVGLKQKRILVDLALLLFRSHRCHQILRNCLCRVWTNDTYNVQMITDLFGRIMLNIYK